MAFRFRKGKVQETDSPKESGGWFPDPYGTAARRWYQPDTGWSDRVQEAGTSPDKTGLERMDNAAVAPDDAVRPVDEDGKPVPLARPVDPRYMPDARGMS
jgi:hypothetical protein